MIVPVLQRPLSGVLSTPFRVLDGEGYWDPSICFRHPPLYS